MGFFSNIFVDIGLAAAAVFTGGAALGLFGATAAAGAGTAAIGADVAGDAASLGFSAAGLSGSAAAGGLASGLTFSNVASGVSALATVGSMLSNNAKTAAASQGGTAGMTPAKDTLDQSIATLDEEDVRTRSGLSSTVAGGNYTGLGGASGASAAQQLLGN